MLLHIFKALTLAVWAIFFLWLITTGQEHLGRLLHPRLWWIIGCGAVILFLFLVVHLCTVVQHRGGRETILHLPGLLMLSVPLLFFSQVMGARFDGDTLMKRGLQTDEGFLQGMVTSTEKVGTNEGSEVSLVKLVSQHEEYIGKEVEVVCQTFADERLPKNTAMCYRFMITCCAADAAPVFIFLQHPDTVVIENDKWVRVQGLMSMLGEEGVAIPSIAINAVVYVEEPSIPWAF